MRMPTGVVRRVSADTPIAVYLKYRGTGTVTSVTIDVSTDLEMVTSVGTETYVFSTYDTIGELVDAINSAFNDGLGNGEWSAEVGDALRSHATSGVFINGLVTATDGFYGIKVDTSAAKIVSRAIRGIPYTGVPNGTPNARTIHLYEIFYFATLGAAGADRLQVYQRDRKGVETLLHSRGSVSGSTNTVVFGNGGAYISADAGAEIIIVLSDTTSISDTGLFLQGAVLIE